MWFTNLFDANWEQLMLDVYRYATDSPDPRTQNAAFIYNKDGKLISLACNRMPRGVKANDSRWERPNKYNFVEHAERNAIYKSAEYGCSTYGGTMVAPWAACCDCARAIIQSGIRRVVRHKEACERGDSHWLEQMKLADEMFEEADIDILELSVTFDEVDIRHSGELWRP